MNIFIEMVICVAVDGNSDSRQESLSFYKFPRYKDLKQQYKYPAVMTRQYASCLLLRLKSRLEKVAISAALNKTFCPTPPTLIHRRFKHRQKTKINKTMLSSSP